MYLISQCRRPRSRSLVVCGRACDSTGGVKVEKGLWLACPSTGDSTGGRADGPAAMLCFVLLNSLMSALLLSLRRRSHHVGMKTTSLSGTVASETQPGVHISLAMS